MHFRLHLNLPEHLNAEIALGTVKSGKPSVDVTFSTMT
jgi:hypothetical protein